MDKDSSPSPERRSSKRLVSLAQEVMQRTEDKSAVMLDHTTVDWLIISARSLAGSVLSQANPDD